MVGVAGCSSATRTSHANIKSILNSLAVHGSQSRTPLLHPSNLAQRQAILADHCTSQPFPSCMSPFWSYVHPARQRMYAHPQAYLQRYNNCLLSAAATTISDLAVAMAKPSYQSHAQSHLRHRCICCLSNESKHRLGHATTPSHNHAQAHDQPAGICSLLRASTCV